MASPSPLQALALLPTAVLAGLLVFTLYIRRYAGGYWGWMPSIWDRLQFMIWPRPPRNIVKIVMPDGRVDLVYEANVRETRGAAVLETPMGIFRVSPHKPVVTGLNVYVPGRPSPLHYVVGAVSGHITVYLVLYYGMLAMGFGATALWALLVLAWSYMWYQAAMTPNTMYYPIVVLAAASGYYQAAPMPGEALSPREFLRYAANRGVTIVVDREARRALYEVAELLGERDINTAAELMSTASAYSTLTKTLTSATVRALRLGYLQRSIGVFLGEEVRRATIGKVAVWAIFFLLGVVVGWALFGGGQVVITTQPVPAGG